MHRKLLLGFCVTLLVVGTPPVFAQFSFSATAIVLTSETGGTYNRTYAYHYSGILRLDAHSWEEYSSDWNYDSLTITGCPEGESSYFGESVTVNSDRESRLGKSNPATHWHKEYRFYPDNSAPSLMLQPAPSVWTGQSQTVTLSVSDTGVGVATTTVNGTVVSGWFVVDHAGTYEIVATDKLGNATTKILTVSDGKPPTVPSVTASTAEWTRGAVMLTASGSTDESGVSNYEYSTDSTTWTTGQTLTVNSNGTVYFRAVDVAGNTSVTSQYTVGNIDTVLPSTPTVTLSLVGGGTTHEPSLASVLVTWSEATDTTSGVSHYEVAYDPATGSEPAISTTVGATVTNHLVPISRRDAGTPYKVSVRVYDKAGNVSTGVKTIIVPPAAQVQTMSAEKYPDSNQDAIAYVTLTLTDAQIKNYESLQLTRQSEAGRRLLPAGVDNSVIPLTQGGALIDPSRWTRNDQGQLVYIDRLSAASGAGNKWIKYRIDSRIAGLPEYGNVSGSAKLADHIGVAEDLVVYDMNNHAYGPPGSGFALDASKKVLLYVAAIDVDNDDLVFSVERVLRRKYQGATLASYRKLSGEGPIAFIKGQPLVEVQLNLGMNHVQVFWANAEDRNITFSSQMFDFEVAITNGVFTLKISKTDGDVETTESALVAHPGETLDFAIEVPSATAVSWNFGDGRPEGVFGGAWTDYQRITYTYHQQPNRTGAVSELSLSVTVTTPDGPSTLDLPVKVTDTQDGPLYESETWVGPHTVLGTVIVPPTMTLAMNPGSSAQMTGSIGSGHLQGFEIEGSLIVADGVKFGGGNSDGGSWGTILVKGVANIGAARVEGAERAITVAPNSTLNLIGATLEANTIGVHVFGPSQVLMDQVKFLNNTLYGVKEERNGRPTVKNSLFTKSARSYYSWDHSLIDIAALSALSSSNTGNGVVQ